MKEFINKFCKENYKLATGTYINVKDVVLTLVKYENEIQDLDMTVLFTGILEALKLESVRNLEGSAFSEIRAQRIAKINSELKAVYELIDKSSIKTVEELKDFIKNLKKGFNSKNLIQISPNDNKVEFRWSGHEHSFIVVKINILGIHKIESTVLRNSERKSIFKWRNMLGFLTEEMDPGIYTVICRNNKLIFKLKKS